MAAFVLLASNNPDKLAEFRLLLGDSGFDVLSPADVKLELCVDEIGHTFAENARLKADAYCRASHLTTLADDSGLVVDALGGDPGVRSARYAGPGATNANRIDLVLDRLRDVPAKERTARFVAAVAIAQPEKETMVFEAYVEGMITSEPKGNMGFGYDPIFLYSPAGLTFAQMNSRDKALVSHRGKAVREAMRYLESAGSGCILDQSSKGKGSV